MVIRSCVRSACRLLTIVAALGACRNDPVEVEVDRVVEGVDLDELFAEPDATELAAVLAEWDARTPEAAGVAVEDEQSVALGSASLSVRVVSHTVDGARHFGAVVVPEGEGAPLPVIVYAHGGDGGATVEELLLQLGLLGDVATAFVWVVPSFRSEPLGFDGRTWVSEGEPSPWDRDVDDALALLEVALQVESAADESSVAVLGFSRGAGVGLLMAIRDARVDRVVEFFGPTDFFDVYVQDVVEDALRGLERPLPGLSHLDQGFIQPLRRGEITMAEARLELVRRSAVLFADRLPAVQVHHGTADTVVEVSQAESLIDAMESLGRVAPDFQAYLYAGVGHGVPGMSASVPRTVEFLTALSGAALAESNAQIARPSNSGVVK